MYVFSLSCGKNYQITSSEVVEPVDYEDFLQQHQGMVSRDPLRDVLEFPEGDVEVGIVPRKIRTEMLVVPEDPPYVPFCPAQTAVLYNLTCVFFVQGPVERWCQGHSPDPHNQLGCCESQISSPLEQLLGARQGWREIGDGQITA